MQKTIWITGASSGIGREFARRYAAMGCRLILTARRADRLQALAEELHAAHGTDCRIETADLSRAEECSRLCEALADEQIDIFINNAGFGVCGSILETEEAREEEMIQVNVAAMARLFRAVVRAVNGRIPVIANVGDNCTADTVYFAQDAAKQGVDGFMCVVPYYNKPPQEGLYRHFKTIADSTDMPIILYNIPGRCSINMEGDTTLRLAHNCDNVVAIKEASGNFEQIKYIIDNAPAGFDVYSGDDSSTLDIMELGGVGVISTIGNVAPDIL